MLTYDLPDAGQSGSWVSLSDSRRSWEESSRQSTKGAGALGKTQVSGNGLIKKLCRGIQQDWERAALLALLFPTITLSKPVGWLVHHCTLSWQGWLLALWAGNMFQVNWIVFLRKPKSITLLPVCPQLEFTQACSIADLMYDNFFSHCLSIPDTWPPIKFRDIYYMKRINIIH